MRVYVSADIEGVCGTTAWEEARKESPGAYRDHQRQMTAEVAAACRGAQCAGADVVVVKDSHGDGRNLVHADLPRGVQLTRAYNGHPFADDALCREVEALQPAITTVAVKSGEGASTTNLHPADAVEAVEAAAARALEGDAARCCVEVPAMTRLEVVYKDQAATYARSWYPGAELVDPHTVRVDLDDWFEVMRALMFVV